MHRVRPYVPAGLTHHLSLSLRPLIGIYANVPDDTDVL